MRGRVAVFLTLALIFAPGFPGTQQRTTGPLTDKDIITRILLPTFDEAALRENDLKKVTAHHRLLLLDLLFAIFVLLVAALAVAAQRLWSSPPQRLPIALRLRGTGPRSPPRLRLT